MLIHWIWYAELPKFNVQEKVELLRCFEDPEDLYFAETDTLRGLEGMTEAGVQALQNKDLSAAEEILHRCEDREIEILTYGDRVYPESLKSISDPPLVLYYRGHLPDFGLCPYIGVVGTRKATGYGLSMAKRMGFQIARCGGAVISGCANGIDAMAMEGALTAGGTVIGLMACGVDVVYPANRKALLEDTCRAGCLISEYPPGVPPLRWHFERRNRIISGLSCGVLVVEAPRISGALITARHAREQGRDVFVTTGNGGLESCAGSNDLLRSGALYADCGWDVIGEYADRFPNAIRKDSTPYEQIQRQNNIETPAERVAQNADFNYKKSPYVTKKHKKGIDNRTNTPYSDLNKQSCSLTPEEQTVLAQVSEDSLVDDVIAASGLPAGAVLAALTMLEIKGLTVRRPGRRVCRKEQKP